MALSVVPAIPASQIVDVIPSVLSAGGNALDLIGVILTNSDRVPIGDVLQFVTATDVDDYFGSLTQESALGAIYFLGYNNSTAKPGKLLFTQFNTEDVAAYLRGGSVSALTLPELQAISGPLAVTIDGVLESATIDLSSATSFSNAGELIGQQLDILGELEASVTASLNDGTASVTGSIAGQVLTVSAVGSGALYPGSVLSGTGGGGVVANTEIISQITGTTGQTGTYAVSISQSVSSTTITGSRGGVMEVSAVSSGTISSGQVLQGSGITPGTYVTELIGGTGGTGSYGVSVAQTVGSENIALYASSVTYDSVSGAFVVRSGTTGVASSITFASGSGATSLKLTSATGAVLSQGAAAADPTAFMDNVITLTQDWVSFMTTFEPTEDQKEAFALWTNNQRNRYLYVMVDTNVENTGPSGPSQAVETIVSGNYSGTAMIYEDPAVDTVGEELAAFLMGAIASLDFTRTNGRATMAFRAQSGLQPQVFSASVANYLKSYGLNFYGDYTTANQAFTFFYPGSVTGDFRWLDSYVNQIWLNSQLQLALMGLLTNTPSIPYNVAGYSLIEAACLDPINAAVNFGAIRIGVTLSEQQKAQVNSAAGLIIDGTLSARGWYLQIKDATPQVRAARQSPPMTFWYMDGQSVQQITLASIEVQ